MDFIRKYQQLDVCAQKKYGLDQIYEFAKEYIAIDASCMISSVLASAEYAARFSIPTPEPP